MNSIREKMLEVMENVKAFKSEINKPITVLVGAPIQQSFIDLLTKNNVTGITVDTLENFHEEVTIDLLSNQDCSSLRNSIPYSFIAMDEVQSEPVKRKKFIKPIPKYKANGKQKRRW